MPEEYDDLDFAKTLRADGQVILAGRYLVAREVGRGGMGVVYLAEDQHLENRQVAIKMLPPVLAKNPRAIKALKKEALLAMQLSHPHIVTLRAFEQSDEGVFLVMDYVEGKSLEDILSEKEKLDEQEVLTIFKPIAEALDYAHRRKVIHRDVKPSNIIIASDGTPFIMDFGVAREMKETFTRVTGKGTSGTMPYMSPEQLRGGSPAPAQDIYSLAASMYECLAGHPPFYRGQIEYQIINDQPERIEGQSDHVNAALLAGLAKQPEDRPQSVSELVVRFSRPVQPRKASEPREMIGKASDKSTPVSTHAPVAELAAVVKSQPVAAKRSSLTPIQERSSRRTGLWVLLLLIVAGTGVTVYFIQNPVWKDKTPPTTTSDIDTTEPSSSKLTKGSAASPSSARTDAGGWKPTPAAKKVLVAGGTAGKFDRSTAGGPRSSFLGVGGNAHHVVYVIDRSGSMVDTFAQLKQDLRKSISTLAEVQDFHVIMFTDGKPVESTGNRLVPATEENKLRIGSWLAEVRPAGQTNPIPALRRAFEVLSSANSKEGKLIYLLTDGVFPNNAEVLEFVRSENKSNEVHIHTLLFGGHENDDVEVLKLIAEENGGNFIRTDPYK